MPRSKTRRSKKETRQRRKKEWERKQEEERKERGRCQAVTQEGERCSRDAVFTYKFLDMTEGKKIFGYNIPGSKLHCCNFCTQHYKMIMMYLIDQYGMQVARQIYGLTTGSDVLDRLFEAEDIDYEYQKLGYKLF